MANYTIELGRLKDGFKIFDFNYPFYDESKKPEFEDLFIKRFYNYEICCETPARWRRYLEVTMRTKFPMYNMLLMTAQIDYEKTKNYNVTETQNREVNNDNNVTGSNSLNNSLNRHDSISNSTTFSNQSTDIGNKTNNLDSITDHVEDYKADRKETQEEAGSVDINNEKDLDATKAHSTTPKTLLSLSNLKSGIYASDAERNENTETEKATTTTISDKENIIAETDKRTVKDTVNADNVEASRLENEASGNSSNSGNVAKVETGVTTGTMAQNAKEKSVETYTRTMSGSYGVITEADMLEKHVALQTKLTNIYYDFFEECHDLFMQIWELEV